MNLYMGLLQLSWKTRVKNEIDQNDERLFKKGKKTFKKKEKKKEFTE